MNFLTVLVEDFKRRQRLNRRYSLRAHAAFLGTHHGTLSQILKGKRRLTLRAIERVGPRLLTPGQLAEACISANCAAILRLLRRSGFRPDARWIAVHTGIPLDAVHVGLHRLLHERRLTMPSATRWVATEASDTAPPLS